MIKGKILTIDDDPDILDVLELTLSEQYEILQASNGEEGLRILQKKSPDLIICDYAMPVMSGREFCKALKKDILLRHIPIIMITGKGEVHDRISGIEAGADDYIVKPFDPSELLARIRMTLKRTESNLDANPLTHLPGNTSIMEEFQRHISSGEMFAVGYADLDKFKVYNDVYGFEKGDEVIQETAKILIGAVREVGGPSAFVGHIGGDDFVFVIDDKLADETSEKIVNSFDKKISSFYSKNDYKAGYISGKDRKGNEEKFGLLSISIGIVSSASQEITHVAQISEIAAELKKYAKSIDGSNFVRDKRQN